MKNKKKSRLTMRKMLIISAIIPMILAAVILSVSLLLISANELERQTNNSLVSVINEVGAAFDYNAEVNQRSMLTFAEAPVVKEYLQNTNDATLAAKAQQYTLNYYKQLDGWEGLYLADWNSKVLTHPSDAVIGKVMREGDRLEELRNSMLEAGTVYNAGIITSPASGQLIMSMYAPIYDDAGNPIGYVGAGTIVKTVADTVSDVSALDMPSAYIYFTDNTGIMLYHPEESKVGAPVENEVVKGIIAKLQNNEKVEPGTISYQYHNTTKYAAYYVGLNDSYIAVLTVDQSNVLSKINMLVLAAIIMVLIFVFVIGAIALYVANLISSPLKSVAEAIEILGTGDVTVECDAKSHIDETVRVLNSFRLLKKTLNESMTNVKQSAAVLNDSIINVDEMTTSNVKAISDINTAIDEVADTSQTVASNAQLMADKSVELGKNIDMLNENVSILSDESISIQDANNEATTCMQSVLAGANESVEAMKNITDKISSTNTAVTEIGNAIQAIEAIAEQTNLLSLNASIEAARAGESGKGFAVVADEIRTLADSSAASANEIRQIIENIIKLSNETVDISKRVNDVIYKEQEDIITAQDKFDALSKSVEKSIEEIGIIKSMSDTLDEIKDDLTQATTELGAVSEELGATAEQVASNAQLVSSACIDTQESTSKIRNVNDDMLQAIDYFRVE